MSLDKLENYKRYRNDPWEFLTQCVFTLDQVSKDEPIRRFPDKEYLRLYCRFWQKYNLMSIPKSRRMTMSWITISLYVWDAIFHRGRFFAFVSKKEDDANELVNRAKFIVDNLDRSLMPDELIPKYRHVFNVLEFPEINSKIQGFPQGADQLRQFTFSGIFGDESAFWENAEKFYAASFPTLDGGGRMTLVSSPAPGFFKKLTFDAMDKPGDINVAEYSPDYKRAMEGVRVWQNRKNKFLVFELHYTADPEKRSPEYRESIKASMPLQEYLREYELHWDTFSGQPVYPEFGKIHILHDKPEPVAGLPMLAGIDWGLTPAFVIGQLSDGVLTIFEEITEVNMGAVRFMDKVVNHIRINYPTHSDTKKNWMLFADPAGQAKSQSDESTCFQIASKFFNVVPGPIAWEERRNAVVGFLLKLELGQPAFQLYGRACPVLLKGFEGGYRFDDKAIEIEPNKLRPIKDVHSHSHDAAQYLCAGVSMTTKKAFGHVPTPTYFSSGLRGPKHGERIL
jgi:hypothetical protein